MKVYHDLLENILKNGERRVDRTGVGTISLFGPQIEFDLRQGFPAVTTKKLHFQSVVRELKWMLSGSTSVKDLHPCKIWDEWADANGDLGPVYGHQWMKWWDHHRQRPIDQIHRVVQDLRNYPYSRRHIVSAWNVADLPEMKLPPCHCLFQFYVGSTAGTQPKPYWLDCKMYQRSADVFLGVPFNIAQYALLTHIIAQISGLAPRKLIITFGDVHCYNNHTEQIRVQLSRSPFPSPTLCMPSHIGTIDEAISAQYGLINYLHHPAITGDIAV